MICLISNNVTIRNNSLYLLISESKFVPHVCVSHPVNKGSPVNLLPELPAALLSQTCPSFFPNERTTISKRCTIFVLLLCHSAVLKFCPLNMRTGHPFCLLVVTLFSQLNSSFDMSVVSMNYRDLQLH